MIGQRAPQSDNFFKDCKAKVVGWSRCRLARWMEKWAATMDDDWQQGKWTSITPTHDNSTLASNRLPCPLLDGRQGKTAPAHQHYEDGHATGWDMNKSKGDGSSRPDNNREGAACDKAKAIWNGAVHPIRQRDHIHPSDASLSIHCVCLHPSEATPITKGSTPSLGESLMVNKVNLSVNGNSPLPAYSVHVTAHGQRVGWHNPGVPLAPVSVDGLHPPVLAVAGNLVTGLETDKLRLQNRRQHHALQDTQLWTLMWTRHLGRYTLLPA
jgi:hypothetical protein